ncbi:S8 family serine peptidase [bacterium]|nr:S8 family serine peptidase [bacterium]
MISGIQSSNNISMLQQTSQVRAPQCPAQEEASVQNPNDSVSFAPQTKLEKTLAATASRAAEIEANMAPHEPGEILVKTKPSLFKGADSIAERYGASLIEKFDMPSQMGVESADGELIHLKLPAGMTTAQAMAAMEKDGTIEYAVPNHVYQMEDFQQVGDTMTAEQLKNAQKMPNDLSDKMWDMHNVGQNGGTVDADIDAPEAWAKTTGLPNGQGPVIAMIDSGVDFNHPELRNNILVNQGEIPDNGIDDDGDGVVDNYWGYNAYSQNGDVMDHSGHGTHVAGTIAAEGNNGSGVVGINWTASLMPIRIFNDNGSTNAAAIIRGINYATSHGARITTNSWGGGGANEAIKEAFEKSHCLHMMSAGNTGTNNDVHPHYPSDYDLPNNLAVAATDRNDQLANFSCYGQKNVDIAAPGKDILSTVPGGKYAVYSGTSMATPHVTGAVGLLLAQDPTMSNDEIKERIMNGGDKLPQLDGKVASGARLNVNGSLEYQYQGNIAK